MTKQDRMHDRARHAVYVKGPLVFMPHYNKQGLYVAPGYRQNGLAYTPRQLNTAGAVREYRMLWSRGRDA